MVVERMRENAQDFEVVFTKILSCRPLFSPVLSEAMAYSSLNGGKRFRPFLVQQVSSLFNVPKNVALEAAASIELIHCYSLVHDDLPAIDNDDLRRGQPTNHKKYDEATAILVGDALQSLAFEHLSRLNVPDNIALRLIRVLSYHIGWHGMVAGQMLDIESEKKNENQLSLQDIKNIQQLKTGALIGAAAQFGAILGSASEEEEKNIHAWGLAVGEAFQITDDLLDNYGDESKTGKRVQKDDSRGKVTFVSMLGQEGAKKRVSDLQESAERMLKPYSNKAKKLNDLWAWLVKRDS